MNPLKTSKSSLTLVPHCSQRTCAVDRFLRFLYICARIYRFVCTVGHANRRIHVTFRYRRHIVSPCLIVATCEVLVFCVRLKFYSMSRVRNQPPSLHRLLSAPLPPVFPPPSPPACLYRYLARPDASTFLMSVVLFCMSRFITYANCSFKHLVVDRCIKVQLVNGLKTIRL